MCVWQPCVEWEEWYFHRKCYEEAEEQKFGRVVEPGNRAALDCALNLYVIKVAELDIKPNDRSQHEHRRDHRVQEELHGGVDAALVSVHADHQRHGMSVASQKT